MSLNIRLAPLGLFVILALKLLILGSNFQDAAILLVLLLGSAYFDYKASSEQMKALEEKIDKQALQLTHLQDDIIRTSDKINGFKLGQQIKFNVK